jgi:hypothetical protein
MYVDVLVDKRHGYLHVDVLVLRAWFRVGGWRWEWGWGVGAGQRVSEWAGRERKGGRVTTSDL